jgi:hypothetical protein
MPRRSREFWNLQQICGIQNRNEKLLLFAKSELPSSKMLNQQVETPFDGTIQFGGSKRTSLVLPHTIRMESPVQLLVKQAALFQDLFTRACPDMAAWWRSPNQGISQ